MTNIIAFSLEGVCSRVGGGVTPSHSITKKIRDFQIRWLVEVFFSVFKRLFGEKIWSKKFEQMSIVMQFKYRAYTIHWKLMLSAIDGAYNRMDNV